MFAICFAYKAKTSTYNGFIRIVFTHDTIGKHGSPLQLNNYFVTFIRFVFIIVYMPLLAGIRKTINAKLLQK